MRSRDSRAAPALPQKSAGKQDPAVAKKCKKAQAGKRIAHPGTRIAP